MAAKHRTSLRTSLPVCDGCGKRRARYDCKTFHGPWANLCDICWPQLRAVPDLGLGVGQYLYLGGETIPTWVLQ